MSASMFKDKTMSPKHRRIPSVNSLALSKHLKSLLRVGIALTVVGFVLSRIVFRRSRSTITTSSPVDYDDLACRHLPGANDTVVILRTGSTELAYKLPMHLATTIKCYPHYMIFSDHHEDFQGETIHDALENVNPNFKEHRPEFEFYRRVREHGREALKPSELINKEGLNRHPSDEDKLKMGGWVLDKWKFLPVWEKVYDTYPNHNWYIFIEADTYLFWSNLLKYTAAMDASKPIYAGAELFIDWTKFAHGGGGTLMSNSAMRLFSEEYKTHVDDWEVFVDRHWAGDIVLGRAMNAAGVTLTSAWPHFHAHAPGNDTYFWAADDRRFWCYPVVSYHHVAPGVVDDLWHFESSWIEREVRGGYEADPTGQTAMKRKDVFQHFTHSQMEEKKEMWDNDSKEPRGPVVSVEACEKVCEASPGCLQYRFDGRTTDCFINTEAKLGDWAPASQFVSGWMYDRVRAWIDDQIPCRDEGWIIE